MVKKSTRAQSSEYNNKIANSKRSQFKIQQTSFMLVGVAFFFVLVLVFWISIQYRGLKAQANELKENQAIVISEFLSGSTEFSCAGKQYCIDTDKLMVLKSFTSYGDFWPVSYIKVWRVYPSQDSITCTIANYPNCSIYNVYSSRKSQSNSSVGSFVALCRHERIGEYAKQICELGRISIGYDIIWK